MSRRRWAGRARLVQLTTLILGVALLALVVWSVTRLQPPSPPPISGSWLGVGSVYDSSGGGSNQLAALLKLTQTSEGQVTGTASECNDQGQTGVFPVSGVIQGNALTLVLSGVTLHGKRTGSHLPMTGSNNGTTIQLDLRHGNRAEFATACDAIHHEEATLVPYMPSSYHGVDRACIKGLACHSPQ